MYEIVEFENPRCRPSTRKRWSRVLKDRHTRDCFIKKKTCVCDAQKRPFTCTQKAKTGLEKIPSGGLGQVTYLPNEQGSEQVTSNKVIN